MIAAMSVLHGNKTYYYEIPEGKEITVSGEQSADVYAPGFGITMFARVENDCVRLSIADGENQRTLIAKLDKILEIDETRWIAVYFTQISANRIAVALPQNGVMQFGRVEKLPDGTENDTIINLPFVSKKHFQIERQNGETWITDISKTNGIFLNGVRCQRAKLTDGDIISIWTARMTFRDGKLYFENVKDRLKVCKAAQEPDDRRAAALHPVSPDAYKYIRTPRIMPRNERGVITLEKPPRAGNNPQMNWLSVLITPMITVVLLLILVFVLGMSPVMLAMSGVMSVMSAVIAVINYRKQKKQHGQTENLIDEKYHTYLKKVGEKIEKAHKAQLENLLCANPAPETCLSIVSERKHNLWERRPTDDDFLRVRLGLGTIDADVTAAYQQAQIVIEENELENTAVDFAKNTVSISNAPVLCHVSDCKQIGVSGDRAAEIRLMRNIVVELATAHSYDELKIVAIIPKGEEKQWDWLRWLPHCADEEKTKRYIFTSVEEAESVLGTIGDELAQREKEQNNFHGTIRHKPYYVFLFADYPAVETSRIRKYIFSKAPCGVSSFFVYSSLNTLPKECQQIIEVTDDHGRIYSVDGRVQDIRFVMDKFSLENADTFARTMAPIFTDVEKKGGGLPTNISFLQGYGISRVEELNIAERWKRARTYKSLSVPIAMMPNGRPFEFDIHEKRHGVHGIVAGMAGSGKTEMVQSWLLSLAVNYSPQDVSFVLIDFKGSGFLAPFENLPHLAGSISNLDKNIDRCLHALEKEITRRTAILDKYGKKIGRKLEINSLNEGYDEGRFPEKLPILIIAIDEYAEFKASYPDFGAVIDSIARAGRSLGMWLMLMTQNPAGIVSAQSESNVRYRWCLRVANSGASRDMLGTDDAAKIPNAGRAYIKAAPSEKSPMAVYEQVQSFWSGAPYDPDAKMNGVGAVHVSRVLLHGKRVSHNAKTAVKKTNKVENTEIARYITDYCRENGVQNAVKVWDEPLPERLALDAVLPACFDGNAWPEKANSVAIGLVDDPYSQSQYPLEIDFAQNGHIAIFGAPTTGKTTLLKTLIMSAALTQSPDRVSFYAMDFGGRNLGVLENLPHMGGIAYDNEPDRLKKLTLLIQDMLHDRIASFSVAGVGNIAAYRQEKQVVLPDVIIAVDNLLMARKMYPELDEFFQLVTSTGANYGIYLAATVLGTNLPFNIAQNIKYNITLQLSDKTDFTALVGKVTGPLPEIMGRGYIKGEKPLEFQTALPTCGNTDKEISDNIRSLSECMQSCWQGTKPCPIPELPDRIPYGAVATDKICLGISKERVQPVCYTHDQQHFLLISGTGQSGKTNMLQVIARQMKEKLGGSLYALDILGEGMADIRDLTDKYITSASDMDAFFEELRPELQRRFDEKQVDMTAHFSPIIIAIDDYGQFFKEVSNECIARLLPIVKIAKGLDVYLIIAGDCYDLTNLYNKGQAVSVALGKGAQAVVIGGCMADHGAVQIKATYAQKNETLDEFNAIYVNGAGFTAFKTMESIGVK